MAMDFMTETKSSAQLTRERLSSIWWVFLLRGIALIVLGAFAIFQPGLTAVAYVNVLAIFVLVDGVFRLVSSFASNYDDSPWWWYIISGGLEILVGMLVLANPLFSTLIATATLFYFIAITAIIGGVLEIVSSIAARDEYQQPWLMFLTGALTLIFGIFLIAMGAVGVAAMIVVFGIYAIFAGVASIWFAFQIREVKERVEITSRSSERTGEGDRQRSSNAPQHS